MKWEDHTKHNAYGQCPNKWLWLPNAQIKYLKKFCADKKYKLWKEETLSEGTRKTRIIT